MYQNKAGTTVKVKIQPPKISKGDAIYVFEIIDCPHCPADNGRRCEATKSSFEKDYKLIPNNEITNNQQ